MLTRQNYDIVMDQNQPEPVRLAAFANRAAWIAPLGTTSYTDQINNMIHHFDHLGVVEVNPGPQDEIGKTLFPALISVEDEHRPIKDDDSAAMAQTRHVTMKTPEASLSGGGGHRTDPVEIDLTAIDKVRRFPRGLRR